MKKKRVHIRVRKNTLFLDFFFRGERTVRTLGLKNTPENIIIAEELARKQEEALVNTENSMIEAGFLKDKLSSQVVKDYKIIKKQEDELKKIIEDYNI